MSNENYIWKKKKVTLFYGNILNERISAEWKQIR